jgi:hypothetical protein
VAGQGILRLVAGEAENPERRHRRFRVLLSASLITTTNEFMVKLRDLSCTGAMVEGMRLPPAGTDLILKRGGLEIFAAVAWSEGRHAGLTFEEAISETELLSQIHQAPAQNAAVVELEKRRPGFKGGRLSAEDRELVAEWANPAGRRAYRD